MSRLNITSSSKPFQEKVLSVRHVKGSKVKIYKQDPSVSGVGVRTLWLPETIRYGPRTEDVEIRGLSKTFGSTGVTDDYLYDPEEDSEAFDAVNTLVMVQKVMNLCRRSLRRSGVYQELTWVWGKRPIKVWPRAGEMVNAFYQRDDQSLVFYYFKDEIKDKWVYTCRSWDIVAHETGHAILDTFHPQWLPDSQHYHEAGGLNEAFCDLVAIFGLLEQLDMCETIVTETKGNLSGPRNLLSCLGEEFGAACGLPYGIRNAQDDVTMSNTTYNIHQISKVVTGAVYDVLVRLYEHNSNLLEEDPAETLHKSAKVLFDTILRAIIDCPETNPKFSDFATKLVQHSPNSFLRTCLEDEFRRRYVRVDVKRDYNRVTAETETLCRANSLSQKYTDSQITSRDQYCCGTILAVSYDSVKIDVKRDLSALNAKFCDMTCQDESVENFDAGKNKSIVHVPWVLP